VISAPRPVLLALAIGVALLGVVAALYLPRLAGEEPAAATSSQAPASEPAPTAAAAAAAALPTARAGTPAADVPAAPPAVAAPSTPTAAPTAVTGPAGAADDDEQAAAIGETASAERIVRPPAPRLPVASRWALPPIMTLTVPASDATAGRRALRSPNVALAPAIARRVAKGGDASGLAPLVALPRDGLGPLLVLGLQGRTVLAQATSLDATRKTLEALLELPPAARPQILLEAAPQDVADATGPPPPRAGELATLVPIYQAAGSEYGIDWRILAAINLVETGLGTNTHVSYAGAVGWMQFMPATWRAYGRDASGDGIADPYDPYDAIYSAANYLEAAGARTDIAKAIWAYNHADWYVRMVLEAARNLPEPFRSAG
jgi:hypothetical protein